MDKSVLAPLPLWATLVHALTLAVSLFVIAWPEARIFPMRALLTLLFFFVFFHAVLRLSRAKGLTAPMRELSTHLPSTHSFAESLGLIAMTVAGFTQVLAF